MNSHCLNLLSMRTIFFIFLEFLLNSSLTIGQSDYKNWIDNPEINFYDACQHAENYFNTIDKSVKGSGWKPYLRWKHLNESRFYPSGNRANVDYHLAQQTYNKILSSNNSRQANVPWFELGPTNANYITSGYNPGIGRVECLEVNPNDDQNMYMGSRSGGFYKTTDGGKTWKNTTQYLSVPGVHNMTVNPLDFNEVFISLAQSFSNVSHGIFHSTDGGETWQATALNSNTGFGGLGSTAIVKILAFHPLIKDMIFVGTNNGLYRSTDKLKSYTYLLPDAYINELAFHPTDSKIVYLIDGSSTFRTSISRSEDMGLTFKPSKLIPGISYNIGTLMTSPTQVDHLYFAQGKNIFKSVDKGINFTKIGTTEYNIINDCVISDIDSNLWIGGYVNVEQSTNGGKTFHEVNNWNTIEPDSAYTHADLVVAKCLKGVFYIGTDGYLCRSRNGGRTWDRLNDGTGIREFYRIGISQSNKFVHIGGSQDIGTSILDEKNWNEWNGGDGGECVVHPLQQKYMMGSFQYGTRKITLDGGLSSDFSFNPEEGDYNIADWTAPLIVDHEDQMNVFHYGTKVHSNSKFGEMGAWKEIGNPNVGVINNAAMSSSNFSVMAISGREKIMLSGDKGKTWKSITQGLPNLTISAITFDPSNDSTIIVCYDNYMADDQKIFISKNLGTTWQNITYNLSNMPIHDVIMDRDRNIYLGCEIGVFSKSIDEPTWKIHNVLLPNVAAKDLEIHQGSNTLKAATWGRGLWETTLLNKETFPRIVKVIPSIELNNNRNVPINNLMNVSCTIDYTSLLKSVYLLWGTKNKTVDQRIEIIDSAGLWKSKEGIPSLAKNTAVYFKIVAVGSQSDTSETYTFMYRQGECSPQYKTIDISACRQYIFENDTITSSKKIVKNFKDKFSCDSIVTYNFIIDQQFDKTITKVNRTLIANNPNATSYQWLDCQKNYSAIIGETKFEFNPKTSGQYALEIKSNSCIDTSECLTYIFVTSDQVIIEGDFQIVPNPNSGNFIVNIKDILYKDLHMEIKSIDGRLLFSEKLKNKSTSINSFLPEGIYTVAIYSDAHGILSSKIISVKK